MRTILPHGFTLMEYKTFDVRMIIGLFHFNGLSYIAWEMLPRDNIIYYLNCLKNDEEVDEDIFLGMNWHFNVYTWISEHPTLYLDQHSVWKCVMNCAIQMMEQDMTQKCHLTSLWYAYLTGRTVPDINDMFFSYRPSDDFCFYGYLQPETVPYVLKLGEVMKPQFMTMTKYIKKITGTIMRIFKTKDYTRVSDELMLMGVHKGMNAVTKSLYSYMASTTKSKWTSNYDVHLPKDKVMDIKTVSKSGGAYEFYRISGYNRRVQIAYKEIKGIEIKKDALLVKMEQVENLAIIEAKKHISKDVTYNKDSFVVDVVDSNKGSYICTVFYVFTKIGPATGSILENPNLVNVHSMEETDFVVRFKYGACTTRIDRRIDELGYDIHEEIQLSKATIGQLPRMIANLSDENRTLVVFADDLIGSVLQNISKTEQYDVLDLKGRVYITDELLYQKISKFFITGSTSDIATDLQSVRKGMDKKQSHVEKIEGKKQESFTEIEKMVLSLLLFIGFITRNSWAIFISIGYAIMKLLFVVVNQSTNG